MNTFCSIVILVLGWDLLFFTSPLVSSQNCASDSYTFPRYYNDSHFLDLTTRANEIVAQFTVANTVSVRSDNDYIAVNVEGDQLIFSTTEEFVNYEKLEVEIRIHMSIIFTCTSGTLTGSYYQNLLEANNHAPEFSRSQYDVTVPLPLPKNFDLSPFIDGGKGITAIDYDLVHNEVNFTIDENPYLRVESVKNGFKESRGIVRLKEQILRLPGAIELQILGTDLGVPAKSSSAMLKITPDLTIEYDDPPVFQRTFISEDFSEEVGNEIVVELVPQTVHGDVEYRLVGEDAAYFRISVEEDKSKALVIVNREPKPPKGKFFLSVVVEASRSGQKAECVVLIDLKESLTGESNVNTVKKTLSIVHLEEERVHEQVFPGKLDECTYEIIHELPNRTERIFNVNESTGWITASKFNREDAELFASVDPPQFQLVLQLKCQTSGNEALPPPVFVDDIPYSVDATYLNIVVDDINDNSPEFTFPVHGDVFAFPVARLSERLLPSKLLQVVARDLDAGLNAIIRFSMTENAHFGINPQSGVVYPLKNAFYNEEPVELEIVATDRDGAEDGNVSKLTIRVVPALPYQMSILQMENVNETQLAQAIEEAQSQSALTIRVISGGYTSLGATNKKQQSSNSVQRIIVVAFDEDHNLISSEQLAKALESFTNLQVSDLEELRYPNKNTDNHGRGDCIVYPYIIVMSVFIVLFVATSALSAYLWFKWRLLATPDIFSNHSENEFVDNPYLNAGSTPPAKRKQLGGVTVDNSTDSVSRSNRLVRSLSDMMIIDEDEEAAVDPQAPYVESQTNEPHQRKKSIRFSEEVERIEVL
ncbi:protocadherin Fat 4-like [Armigeres subalbatus]|uniref:protocadherin Fat 4-like n=1 Tax=Armigeres subalbatus TaxID=124917 RepID=UPI002ED04B25